MAHKKFSLFSILLIASLLLTACSGLPAGSPGGEPSSEGMTGKLKVVATTSLVGDVVTQVGGEWIDLVVVLPLGTDPHSFEPRPQDISAVSDAQLVFINGAGLEVFIETLINNAGGEAELIEVSHDIKLLKFEEHEHEGEEHEHEHGSGDPHTWLDPNNVILWTNAIAGALSEKDPARTQQYQANAEAYITKLHELDSWIRTQVELIPADRRVIVADHRVFGYFADEYGFEQAGAIITSFSTMAEPSAQELAELQDTIIAQGVPAVFVGMDMNPSLAEQVSQDTGIKIVRLYHGSLSEPDGPAGSYLDYMRYNVTMIVEALK